MSVTQPGSAKLIEAMRRWAPESAQRPLVVLEDASTLHAYLCTVAAAGHVNYARIRLEDLARVHDQRLCAECFQSLKATSPAYPPTPFRAVLGVDQNPVSEQEKARLLLAAASSTEITSKDIAHVVAALQGGATQEAADGWILLARAWQYAPTRLSGGSDKWVTNAWHDPDSNWSIVPVVDPRIPILRKHRSLETVFKDVERARRWPHPGRHGPRRLLAGSLWAAFEQLLPYTPRWLGAEGPSDPESINRTCETFKVLAGLAHEHHLVGINVQDIWAAARVLS